MKPPSDQEWSRFLNEAIDFNNGFKYDFTSLTKRFGLSYLYYLTCAYIAKDDLSDEDFCALNGNVPMSFLSKIKKNSEFVLD